MAATDSLYEVFIGEAVAALAVLETPRAGREARDRALAALAQAAEFVGDPRLGADSRRVAELAARSPKKAAAALSAILERLRRRVEDEQGDGADDEPSVDEELPRPIRRSKKFDTAEHQTLLAFFRDEAFEALDRVAQLLAGARDAPDEVTLGELLRATHSVKGAAGTVDLPAIAELSHRLESCFDRVRAGKLPWSPAVQDALIESADLLRALVARASGRDAAPELAEALRRQLVALETTGPAAAPRSEDSRLIVIDSGARADTEGDRRLGERRRTEPALLRVEPARIDRLMDSVGELVFDRTRIQRRVAELGHVAVELETLRAELRDAAGDPARTSELEEKLAASAATLQRTSAALTEDTRALRRTERALQDGLTSVRMQLVRALFSRLAPQLRAIARAAGKRVRMVASGGDTEFDKSVADQMIDPLVQLLRNAVAHGIEPADERRRLGKPEIGTIAISARHEGNLVVIEVVDDGAGIDAAALRRRFVAAGRWSEARARVASDEEVLRTLFEAGVSSRDVADELAGRGVGLSAVQEAVTRLGGEVLLSSTPGKGTTFTLRLPLTTAVAHALLFKVGGHVFALPNVQLCDTAELSAGAELPAAVRARDESAPVIDLHRLLGFSRPHTAAIAVAEYAGKPLAFSCDKVVGPREIVLKSLGPLLAALPLYAGGTISGSGKVQLILDPAALARRAAPTAAPDVALPTPTAGAAAPLGHVLVVDDSRAVRQAMLHLLERSGYQVQTAKDGREAWTLLERAPCDVLVTDLEMPVLDGFGLIERIRADPRFASLPVLIISSRVDEPNRDRARALRVDAILAKPVTQAELAAALSQISR